MEVFKPKNQKDTKKNNCVKLLRMKKSNDPICISDFFWLMKWIKITYLIENGISARYDIIFPDLRCLFLYILCWMEVKNWHIVITYTYYFGTYSCELMVFVLSYLKLLVFVLMSTIHNSKNKLLTYVLRYILIYNLNQGLLIVVCTLNKCCTL